MTSVVHTVYDRAGRRWGNRYEGSNELFGVAELKVDAVSAGREEAIGRRVAHCIHNIDGTISSRQDYGLELFPSEDR